MTVPDQTPQNVHTANGVSTTFAYQFKILDTDHLEVYLDDVLQTSGYTVTGEGVNAGGTVVFTTAPANGTEVILMRSMTIERTAYDYQNAGDFLAATVNEDFDAAIMITQQINHKVEQRVLLFPKTLDRTNNTNALPVPAPGQVLYWDENGEIQNGQLNSLANDVTFASELVLYDTMAQAIADADLTITKKLLVKDRANSIWDVVLSSGVTENGFNIVQCVGVPTLSLVLRIVNKTVPILALGASDGGVIAVNSHLLAARDIIAAEGGGLVYFPAGTYLFDINTDMQDSFAEGMVIKGDGASTVIKFSGGQSIRALSLENAGISDVHLDSQNGYISFELCDKVRIERVSGQGLRTSGGDLSQRGFEIRGCAYTEVLDCDFDNYNYAVFFLKSGTTSCGTARIRGGLYQHTDPTSGTGVANPCGIYAWQIAYVFVEGVAFKNIKPSDAAGSPFYGFGVYEGDGTDGELEFVSVKDCIFIRDTVAARGSLMVGVLTSLANVSVVDNCEFIGEFTGYRYGTRDLTISNCKFKGATLFTGPTAGVPGSGNTYTRFVIRNNEFSDITTNIPIILQNGSPVVQNVIVEGNTFRNSLYGAMWVRFVTHATILNNTIIDCNTSGNSLDFYRGGINFSGSTSGFVHGNTVINLTSGNAQYGVVSAASSHQITVTESNKFIGMKHGRFLRGYTSAPTFGTYEKGDRIKNWEVEAAGIPGYICTTVGTMGTLNGGATTGSITSGLSALTVNTTDFMVIGQYINVAGVTGPFRIENISGLVVTLSGNADATVSGAAVSFSNGVFKAEAAIAA